MPTISSTRAAASLASQISASRRRRKPRRVSTVSAVLVPKRFTTPLSSSARSLRAFALASNSSVVAKLPPFGLFGFSVYYPEF